jgi:predicted aspartyl protease
MKLPKILAILLLIVLAVWGAETIWLFRQNVTMPSQIKKRAENERSLLKLQFLNKEQKLNDDYGQKKYLASGQTVYERIFNTKDQTIDELIQKIAAESIPHEWDCEVKIEEFTHFMLLIYLPNNVTRVEASKVVSYLIPLIKYCNFCLSDVAVFDSKHKSYLFFDIETLKHIEKEGKLTDVFLTKVKQQGESFTRFNSITIQCQKYEQHLVLPLEIIGSSGVETCVAIFDTGASITTISSIIISKTGQDNLSRVSRETFSTANGLMSCPIVYREVNLGGFRKRIEVAVNQTDEINLLGMNYFEGVKYIVDSQNACIYIWEEQ